jgi:ribose-phosphate pyrophosphokinase
MENSMILCGNSHPELGEEIAKILEIPICQRICDKFSNTEIRVKVENNIRNKHMFIVQTGTYLSDKSYSINDYLMETLIMIDTCRRSMVKSISLIMPCYPYARQDKKEESREPITSKLIANMLISAGIDRLVVMDLHSAQIQGFFDIPVDNIYSLNLVIDYASKYLFNGYTTDEKREKFIVVSPDAGATKRTLKFAKEMKLNTVIMHKQRNYSKKNCVEKMMLIGEPEEVSGKTALILDDMTDTFGTVIRTAEMLVENYNAKDVICIVTHGILSGPAIDRINASDYIKKVVVSNSIPQSLNLEKCDKLEIFNISKLISEVLRRITSGGSISELF